MKQKVAMEEHIQDMKERLEEEESTASQLTAQKRKVETELIDLKRDLEGLESTMAKTEKERQVRDNSRELKPICIYQWVKTTLTDWGTNILKKIELWNIFRSNVRFI